LGGLIGSRWVSAAFGTLLFTYGGSVFIKGAVAELAGRLPGMMTLISLAISVAFGFSLAVTLGFPGTDLWWELAALVTIMLLGHWIEIRSVSPHGISDRSPFCSYRPREPTARDKPDSIGIVASREGGCDPGRPSDCHNLNSGSSI
jgi:hypothetical protein